MSLINDALKRAETDKLEKLSAADKTGDPPAENGTVFGTEVRSPEPSEPGPPDQTPPTVSSGRLRRGPSPRVLLAVVLMLAAAGLAAYTFWMPKSSTTPKKATAGTGRPKVTRTRPAPKTSKPKAAVTGRPRGEATRPRSRSGNRGPAVRGDEPPATHSALKAALAGARSVLSKIRLVAPHTGGKDPTTSPADTEETKGPATRPRTGGKTAGPPAARVVPARPAAPRPAIEVSQYKVTGIMFGPSGSTAIINGQLYTAGQKIGQARIVEITRYSVVLEIGGRRVTIGI